jgi:hypothetical protein
MDIVNGKSKKTINSNAVKVLQDYGVKVRTSGIGWSILESQGGEDEEKKKLIRSEVHPVSTADRPNIGDTVTEGKSSDVENWILPTLNKNKVIDGNYEFKNGYIINHDKVNINGKWVKDNKVGTYTIQDRPNEIVMVIKNTIRPAEFGQVEALGYRSIARKLSNEIGKKVVIEVR